NQDASRERLIRCDARLEIDENASNQAITLVLPILFYESLRVEPISSAGVIAKRNFRNGGRRPAGRRGKPAGLPHHFGNNFWKPVYFINKPLSLRPGFFELGREIGKGDIGGHADAQQSLVIVQAHFHA